MWVHEFLFYFILNCVNCKRSNYMLDLKLSCDRKVSTPFFINEVFNILFFTDFFISTLKRIMWAQAQMREAVLTHRVLITEHYPPKCITMILETSVFPESRNSLHTSGESSEKRCQPLQIILLLNILYKIQNY